MLLSVIRCQTGNPARYAVTFTLKRRNAILNKTKFIEAKLKGKNNTEAAIEAGASTKMAAYKAGYRLSKQVDIKKQLDKAFRRHNITIDGIIAVYAEALRAEKVVITGKDNEAFAEVTPDHVTRMKAGDRFINLMGINNRSIKENGMSQNISQQSTREIQQAMKDGNEVELQRAVFRKVDD